MFNFLIFFFFIHGVLYFIYPAEINNEVSYIKYVKYIILVLFIFYFYRNIKTKSVILIFTISLIIFLLYFINDSNGVLQYTLFMIPMIFMFLYRKEFYNIPLILPVSIYIIISVFGYLEYFVFEEFFSKFSYGFGGYRISSILVNPNNFGITMVFIFIFIYENINKRIIRSFLFLNILLMVYFSLSKTALIILLIYLAFKYFKLTMFIFILALLYFLLSNNLYYDERVLLSMKARNIYNESFFVLANSNIIFPFQSTYQYTDNIYLQIWGYFSIFSFFIFLLFNQIIAIILIYSKKYISVLVLFCFFLTGLTTNYLYLWPLAYMYWGFIFSSISNTRLFYVAIQRKKIT